MTGCRLSIAIAVGLFGLSAPAGAAAASNTAALPYVVTSVNGSATWQYSGPRGAGMDSVTFQGLARRVRTAAGLSSVLRGRTTYRQQGPRGCGPMSQTRSQNFQIPRFSVQQPFVVVRWRFPLPNLSQCYGARGTRVAHLLQGLLSAKDPLSRFTCNRVALQLRGRARMPMGSTTYTLTYKATVIMTRL